MYPHPFTNLRVYKQTYTATLFHSVSEFVLLLPAEKEFAESVSKLTVNEAISTTVLLFSIFFLLLLH